MAGESTILRSASYFPVADVASIGAWYRDVLGFSCEYSSGAEFAIYTRGDATVMLRRVADATLLRPNEAQGGTWDMFCWVTGLDALHRDLAERGTVFVHEPVVREYGMKEFAVRDPAGRVIGFGETLG